MIPPLLEKRDCACKEPTMVRVPLGIVVVGLVPVVLLLWRRVEIPKVGVFLGEVESKLTQLVSQS